MRFDVLTLFPDIFQGYLGESLIHKAIQRDLINVQLHNFRQYTTDKHHKVDDRPFGGGPGMVMMAQPVVECVESVQQMADQPGRLLMMSPQGRRLDQRLVEELAESNRLVLMCGRYEGFDQRVVDILQPEEISIGDYVLNGGEVAAMVLVDAVVRLVPGALGHELSNVEDSFSSGNRMLEHAQYTRPRDFRGHEVPEILFSGNHEEIARWRKEQSYERTRLNRADLLPTDDVEAGKTDKPQHPTNSDSPSRRKQR